MTLLVDYNTPYPFAVSFVLLIDLSEILTPTCGHILSGILDTHLDYYDSIATGHISQAPHCLNIGRLPALVVLCSLTGFFGLIGILLQYACIMVWQSPPSSPSMVSVSSLFTITAVYYTGKIVALWIPRDHSSAITEEEYIGSMVLIIGHQATSGNPYEGKLTDQFGQIRYLLLGLEEGKLFTEEDKVLIICRPSTAWYLAENNPWPQIL